jgi:hypothetical protein
MPHELIDCPLRCAAGAAIACRALSWTAGAPRLLERPISGAHDIRVMHDDIMYDLKDHILGNRMV